MGESHVKNLKLLLLCFSITVPFHRMNLVWNHSIKTAVNVYWWLSALTEHLYCPACWTILPHPWGKLIKPQLFGKQHFKGFCEKKSVLILTRICSQKIKDSQSRLKNSSIFMVSPLRSQEKRCGIYVSELAFIPIYAGLCVVHPVLWVWSSSRPASRAAVHWCWPCGDVGAGFLGEPASESCGCTLVLTVMSRQGFSVSRPASRAAVHWFRRRTATPSRIGRRRPPGACAAVWWPGTAAAPSSSYAIRTRHCCPTETTWRPATSGTRPTNASSGKVGCRGKITYNK